jgi:signal peptidase I
MSWHHTKVTQTFSVLCTVLIVGFSAVALFLTAHGAKFLSVQSGSMVPTFHKGDLVIDTPINPHVPVQQQLAVGDVVTYTNPTLLKGAPITHRLVQTADFANGNHFITKGDANQAADPPITTKNIIGKVGHSLPYAGYAVDFVRKPLGLTILIYIPALLIVFSEMKRLIKYYKDQEPYKLVGVKARSTDEAALASASKAPFIVKTGVVATLFALVFAITVVVPSVRAALRSSATLTPNTISTITTPTSTGVNHLLVYQVDFGSTSSPGGTNTTTNTNVTVTNNNSQTATSGNASVSGGKKTSGSATSGNATNTSNTTITVNTGGSSSSSTSNTGTTTQTVKLYNPSAQAINLAGYTLADNTSTQTIASGTITAKGYFTYTWPVAGGLDRLGDRMILRSPTAGIDSLSWGSDTSQLNPAVASTAATLNLTRKSVTVDTDTASDWQ